jgi:hypothetical protein
MSDIHNRQAVVADEKDLILDLSTYKFEPPAAGIYDEPARYYKANIEWAKILEGHLSWLASPAAWKMAEDEGYSAIEKVLIFLRGIVMSEPPGFDCGDVEDCLETSTIILNLIDQVNNLNEQIDDLQEQLEETKHEQEAGNPLPPNPDMADSGNSVCRGANFIAAQLSDRLLEYWEQASSLSLEEFVNALLSLAAIGFIPATAFWQFVFTLSSPDLADDAVEHTDRIAQAFFCSNWVAETAMEFISDDPFMTENEKALWIVTIELYRQGQFDEWGLIGTLGTTEYDCSEGCPWVIVWVADESSYTPLGDETAIYGAGSWNVDNGTLTSEGWVGDGDVMILTHDLPEQCRLSAYRTVTAKRPGYLAVDVYYWWRGVGGAGAEQYTPVSRNLNDTYTVQTITVSGDPIMTEMRIKLDNFALSGGGAGGQKLGYIRVIGTGVKPSA